MKSSPGLLGMSLRVATSTELCLLFISAISCQHSGSKNGADSGGEGQPTVTFNSDLGVTPEAGIPTRGLTLMDRVVYDSNQNVYWLAEANLAVTPDGQLIRDKMSTPDGGVDLSGINPNGTMDFATAKNWVQALNQVAWNGCQGYLCHTDWQLPVTPNDDPTCSEQGPAPSDNDFAAWCTGSALGNLYGVGLGLAFSNSVVPRFADTAGPFQNLQPSLYWTNESGGGAGKKTFSFLTGVSGENTTKYNYFYLLPRLAAAPSNSPPPSGKGVVPYTSGPAAGKAVYDSTMQITWLLDANLAASQDFGIAGTTEVKGNNACVPAADCDFFEPLVNTSGAMLFDDATTAWLGQLNGMNPSGYAGESTWTLPSAGDLKNLYDHLGLPAQALVSQTSVGPFQHLQPFFYWACVPYDPTGKRNGNSRSPCDFTMHAGKNPNGGSDMEWSYNFDTGFQATDLRSKQFYVMPYYPGS